MSNNADALEAKSVIETLDALQGSVVDIVVLQGLERGLQKALKIVAAEPASEKDAAHELLRALESVQEALENAQDSKKESKVDYTFISKLMDVGLSIRSAHQQWTQARAKPAFMTLVKAHAQWGTHTQSLAR